MDRHAGTRKGVYLVLLGLVGAFFAGRIGALADEEQDEINRCRELKKHGQLLAQQLEASKQCHKHKYENMSTFTCSYSVEGTVVEVESDDPNGARDAAGNVGYTITSLGPNVRLSFGQGNRTAGYPMLKRVGPAGRSCRYDWAWLKRDEVVLASLLADTL